MSWAIVAIVAAIAAAFLLVLPGRDAMQQPTTANARSPIALREADHRRKRVPLILSLAEWEQLEGEAAGHGASVGVAASAAVTDWLYRKKRERQESKEGAVL